MKDRWLFCVRVTVAACALAVAARAVATGVPVGGYLPLVGIGLSNEHSHDLFDWYAQPHTSQPAAGMMLGHGTPFFDMALLDTGAGFSALTAQAYNNFKMGGPYPGNPDGFAGANQIQFGGATGSLSADVNEPLGLYVAGLQNRTGTAPLTMNLNLMTGQTNTSTVTFPAGSDLPNVVGLTFASRYSTSIRNDLPQIFQLNGKTVRTPTISFHPLGSGVTHGITRRAFLDLAPSASFGELAAPVYLSFGSNPDEPWADPLYPTLLQSVSAGTFLTISAKEKTRSLGNSQFLFDTGADVTVLSAFSANQLGYNGIPDFTVAVVGSGGTFFDVPGFFVDELTLYAENHTNHAENNLVLPQVPVIILDVVNPNGGGIVPGIIGTNVITGRNVVFDPQPVGGGTSPGLYISEPITIQKNWTTAAASGTFTTDGNWSGNAAPTVLGIANVRHVSGGNQTAIVAANATAWEVNVSGTASQTMTLQVQSGVTLQTFSGINIEAGGAINLQNSTLDTQFVEVYGGTFSGSGTILTGSGSIPGQVENRGGTVAPGNGVGALAIEGRFASGPAATTAFDLGGTAAGQFDTISVLGDATLDGTLAVSLFNLGSGTFAPSVGNSFTLLTATQGIAGTFDSLNLPAGYLWNLAYHPNSLVLSVTALALPGDFNQSGTVDAADYVVWRNGLGTLYTNEHYNIWRANYGRTSGSGSHEVLNSAVPEPATGLLLLGAGVAFLIARSKVIRDRRRPS